MARKGQEACHDTLDCIVAGRLEGLKEARSYRNTPRCIVTGGKGWGRHCVTTRPGGQATTRRWREALRPRHGRSAHDTAKHARACARWLGQIGCLVHLTQFDLVFGLNIVSESPFGHCS